MTFEEAVEKIFAKSEDKFHTIAVDVDGTLCKETCFTEEECLNATPRWEVINWVKKQYGSHYIIIWTARDDCFREGKWQRMIWATKIWLAKHGIQYHLFDDRKNPFTVYVDDRSVNPNLHTINSQPKTREEMDKFCEEKLGLGDYGWGFSNFNSPAG